RRAEVLLGQSPGQYAARGPGGPDQETLGLRADAPADEGRAGPRPFRGPELAWPAPPRALVPARLRVPAASAARGEKEPAARPSQACPPSAAASWPSSAASSCAAPTAGSASITTSGCETGRVVLIRTLH